MIEPMVDERLSLLSLLRYLDLTKAYLINWYPIGAELALFYAEVGGEIGGTFSLNWF